MPISTQELKRRREDARADLQAARQDFLAKPSLHTEAAVMEAEHAVRRLTRKINQRRNNTPA